MPSTARTFAIGGAAAALLILLAIILGPSATDDGLPPVVPEFSGGRFISVSSAEALEKIFDDAGYDLDAVRRGDAAVPPIYVRRLPADMSKIKETDRRKSLFVRIVLPLALAANRVLNDQYRTLEELAGRGTNLTEQELSWLKRLAVRHRLKKPDPEALKERVAPLPVALILAQAAVESGWGTSRFAKKGNALFGQWTWEPGAGIVPEEREDGKTHAIKSYSRLIDSVWDYTNNLNAHRAYDDFREARAKRLKAGEPLRALPLIETLEEYSERGQAYLDLLEGIIEQNGFSSLNNARLADRPGD